MDKKTKEKLNKLNRTVRINIDSELYDFNSYDGIILGSVKLNTITKVIDEDYNVVGSFENIKKTVNPLCYSIYDEKNKEIGHMCDSESQDNIIICKKYGCKKEYEVSNVHNPMIYLANHYKKLKQKESELEKELK